MVERRTQQQIGSGVRFILLFTSFMCGFAILALELLGFRIFAPVFGYSTYVSASIVGSVLLVLSIGYVIGGWLADKYPKPVVLYRVILAAGVYLFPMLLIYKKIMMAMFRSMGTITGSIFSALIIYAVPMVLLSMVGPFVIRLLAHQNDVGRTAGKVFFVSTIGSLLGTFITPLVLIPCFGSHMTFIVLSSTVLILGILGMFPFNFKYVFALALFGTIPVSFSTLPDYVVYEKESPYNHLQVVKRRDGRYQLTVNWWTSYSTSVSEETAFLTGSYYDSFVVTPMLTEGRDILVLGMGTGTSVKQFEHFYPDARIDAVEIDPEIIRIAREEWFGVDQTDRINIFGMDARPFLSTTDKKYDVIELDMFQGGPNIPFYVTTVEFYEMIYEHLNPGGVITMNVLQLGRDKRLVASVGSTLREVFPKVYETELSGNSILVAFKDTITAKEISAKLASGSSRYPELKDLADNFKLSEFISYPGSQVFTDDKANIEILTFGMVEKHMRNRKKYYTLD